MTPIQTLEIRAGEIRKRLSELGGMTELTDETRSEREAVIAENTHKVAGLQTQLVNEQRRAVLAQREAKQRGWTGKANE